MPGFGVILGAGVHRRTGGDMSVFCIRRSRCRDSGLAPVPRDSGRISGNLKRPRRYDRRLLRACYLSAQIAIPYRSGFAHLLRPQNAPRGA